MRLAIIGNAASTMVNFRAALIREIVENGHTVFALAPDFGPNERLAIEACGATPVDYALASNGLDPLSDILSFRALCKTLFGMRLDVTLSYGMKSANYGTLAARRVGIPARHVLIPGLGRAFTRSGRPTIKSRAVFAAARLLYTAGLHQAQTVFVQNSDDARELVRLGITSPGKICIVRGTGVELDKWHPADAVLSPVTFLMAARLLKAKGVADFVAAARILKPRYPDARFILIGALERGQDAVQPEVIGGWVEEGLIEWPGHVDMSTWLSRASVFVLPSYYREGVPRSTQEAMALARPIVTTDSPGCRETVIEGRNGFLVPPRDPPALAARMEKFLSDPQLIAQMGLESRKLAELNFDARRLNRIMLDRMKL